MLDQNNLDQTHLTKTQTEGLIQIKTKIGFRVTPDNRVGGRGWMGCDVTPDNSVRGGRGWMGCDVTPDNRGGGEGVDGL